MNEAQRFLRYVIPGLVFLAEALCLLLILLPDWTLTQVKAVKGDESLGIVFATLLASGGIGFIFSLLHHGHWPPLVPEIDHSGLIARLRASKVIQLVDAGTDEPIANDATVSREDAWIIVTSVWHERVKTSDCIMAAEPKVGVFVDMYHTTGTAYVASAVAMVVTVLIAANVADPSCELGPAVRFICASAVGAILIFVHRRNCFRVRYLAQGLIEEVLHDALLAEKELPVKTRVQFRKHLT